MNVTAWQKRRRYWLFTDSYVSINVISTYFTLCSSVSIVNLEHVIAGWDSKKDFDWFFDHDNDLSISDGNTS